jgi:hypothetical protein
MTKICETRNPLQRDGVSKEQRLLPALDPDKIKLDDRTEEDLVHFAHQLAAELNFYDLDGEVKGNWLNFLRKISEQPASEWGKTADHEPHVALFLTFLKLFRHSQNHLNLLTARHLDFFYKDILKLAQKKAEPDRVHVLFELNKNIGGQKIEKNTLLNAGKDSLGKPLYYKLEDDIIVNRAQVVHLRSLYNQDKELYHALIANSKDGWGEALDSPDDAWSPFGNSQLLKAQAGFALSSPVLHLSGGVRTVKLAFSLSGGKTIPASLTDTVFLQGFSIFASGEKGWLGPFSAQNPDVQKPTLNKTNSGCELNISFTVPAGEKAVFPYNDSVLKENFNTGSPILKILLSSAARDILDGFRLDDVQISVKVSDMTDFVVENDFGPVDASKPFMPFGPLPKNGSSMYLGSDEVFTRNFSNLKLTVHWQNLPTDFNVSYANYPDKYKNKDNYKAGLSLRSNSSWTAPQETKLLPANPADPFYIPSSDSNSASWKVMPNAVKAELKHYRPVLLKRGIEDNTGKAPMSVMLKTAFLRLPLQLFIQPEKKFFSNEMKEGFLKITLRQDFGQDEFFTTSARVAAEIAAKTKQASDQLKPPYLPVISSLKVSYDAQTRKESLQTNESEFLKREVQLFHLTPFGHSEQHGFIKNHLDFLNSSEVCLVPSFPFAGEFYLGLKDTGPLETVNILFQLAEGSADPDLPQQEVKWCVLTQNHWKPIDKGLLSDNTNGLLRSGIIKILLPKETANDNVLLDSGYTWLRATIDQYPEAVCKATGVHAQAVKAVWENNDNEDSHLVNAMEAGTIKKLENEFGTIKKVSQPYSSFGGRPKESMPDFYVRVSERLRHKNRASNVWDFERLVLEHFPNVHKVKCLNHTGPGSEFSPGEVTLILIPNLRNQNAVDVLKPRMSANSRSEVRQYLQELVPKFITVYIENPDYEDVKVNASVKFLNDPIFYKKQLSEDLVHFLSPWAFRQDADILFNGRVHLSRLILFMEQLPYVDYMEQVSLSYITKKGTSDNLTEVSTSNSKAILVSAALHNIQIYDE